MKTIDPYESPQIPSDSISMESSVMQRIAWAAICLVFGAGMGWLIPVFLVWLGLTGSPKPGENWLGGAVVLCCGSASVFSGVMVTISLGSGILLERVDNALSATSIRRVSAAHIKSHLTVNERWLFVALAAILLLTYLLCFSEIDCK